MHVTIEKYQERDFYSLKRLLEEHYENITFRTLEETLTNFSLVARLEDEVVGHVRLDVLTDVFRGYQYGYINYLCVKTKLQKQGIATLLLKEVEQHAKEQGLVYLKLTSRKERVAAHHLYMKNDFKIRETTVFEKHL